MSEAITDSLLQRVLKGNASAESFLRKMARVLHFYDDLIDRDRPLADEEIHQAMWDALVELPLNEFYREHIAELQPILVNAITNWRIANAFERRVPHDHEEFLIAFVIRSSYVDLFTICALLIGGIEWAVECGADIRRWAHAEGFAEYRANLRQELAARKEKERL